MENPCGRLLERNFCANQTGRQRLGLIRKFGILHNRRKTSTKAQSTMGTGLAGGQQRRVKRLAQSSVGPDLSGKQKLSHGSEL